MERTLVICKPDSIERGLAGEIIGRFERKGLTLAAAQLRVIDELTAARHYEEHKNRPFYSSLVSFITSGPSLLAVFAGPSETFKIVRTLMGDTDPVNAAPGTIRGDLATEMTTNLVHGSDSPISAKREIDIFFPGL